MKRGLVRVALAIAGAYVLFLAITNLLLATGAINALLEREQDNVTIEYSSATSWVPFRVSTRELRVVSQDTAIEFELTADRASAWFSILPLLEKKFVLRDAESEGVRIRMRKSRSLEELCRARPHELPPIGDLARPRGLQSKKECLAQRETQMKKTAPTDPAKLWSVELDNSVGHSVRELWIERMRFLGDASSTHSFVFHPMNSIEIRDSVIEVHAGGILRGRKVIAENGKGRARTSLPKIPIDDDPLEEILAVISSDVHFGAKLETFAFLDTYLQDVGFLSFREGSGIVDAHLAAERGLLLPDSHFTIEQGKLVARLNDHRAFGRGRFDIRVDQRRIAALSLKLYRFDVARSWEKKPALVGRGLKIGLRSSDEARLIDPFRRPDLSIKVEDLHVSDVSLYNAYLPADAELLFVGGEAHATAELAVEKGKEVKSGHITVRTGNVRAKYKKLELLTRVELDAPITRADFEKRRYGLDGMKIALSSPETQWWAKAEFPTFALELPKAKKHGPAPVRLETRVTASLANIRPLLDVFHAADHVPGIVRKLVPGEAKGSFNLALFDGGYTLDSLDFLAGPLRARGNLQRKNESTNGKLALSYLGIQAALEIHDDQTHLALFRN